MERLLWWHLPISFLVSALIAVTHSFFLVEIASHSWIFPTLFRDTRPDRVGALTLTLRGRGVLWAMSAGICPIISLLLLSFAPPAPGTDPARFAVFVGSVGIVFGMVTAILMNRLIAEPWINFNSLPTPLQKASWTSMSAHGVRMNSDC